jgi:predicted alpha/beta hydrolase
MRFYTRANVEQLWLGTDDAGGIPVAHIGFFRRKFTSALWPRLSDWLLHP